MDFSTLCALEYMAMADRENFHTALLAWMLGEKSPLPLARKVAVLNALLGAPLPMLASMTTDTEQADIDLVVTCLLRDGSSFAVVVENKLKSQESEGQLDKYDKELENRQVHTKVFLTLLGDQPIRGRNWRAAGYQQLLDVLDNTAPQNASQEDRYILDLRSMMRRILDAVRLVLHEPRFAQYAFGKKPAQTAPLDEESFASYVERLRLGGLLQRAWYGNLRCQLSQSLDPNWSTKLAMGPRSGSLLDIFTIVGASGAQVRVGLQLQSLVLKAFCSPHPYFEKAAPESKVLVELSLERIRESLSLDASKQATRTRNRGFRSFTLLKAAEDSYATSTWVQPILMHYRKLATEFASASEALGAKRP